MSMKILLALLPLLALTSGQTTGLDKTQELSSVPGRFTLSWSVLQGPGDIILQIQANTTGWVSLSFETATLSDIIIGGYDNNKNLPYVYVRTWTPSFRLMDEIEHNILIIGYEHCGH